MDIFLPRVSLGRLWLSTHKQASVGANGGHAAQCTCDVTGSEEEEGEEDSCGEKERKMWKGEGTGGASGAGEWGVCWEGGNAGEDGRVAAQLGRTGFTRGRAAVSVRVCVYADLKYGRDTHV